MDRRPVRPSWRKPVGMLGVLALILLWTAAVVTLADAARLPPLLTPIVYVAGGIAWLWALPMRRLLRWMELGRWHD